MGARPHLERAPKNNGGAPSSCGRFVDFLLFFMQLRVDDFQIRSRWYIGKLICAIYIWRKYTGASIRHKLKSPYSVCVWNIYKELNICTYTEPMHITDVQTFSVIPIPFAIFFLTSTMSIFVYKYNISLIDCLSVCTSGTLLYSLCVLDHAVIVKLETRGRIWPKGRIRRW